MEVKIIRSKRKTISIQINPDMTVTVRAPKRASTRDIEKVLKDKESWIIKHLEKMQENNERYGEENSEPLSNEEIQELADKAVDYIPGRAEYYSQIIGVNYGRITIRNQKTRWGSCSSKGNLNFNCLLMLTPPEVIDYVVAHELCHLKEMNHSKAFWNEVSKVIPNYKEYVKWLKNEGSVLMRRLK